MEKRKIELLAPAGDMERLKMAVAYGADAVYLAGTTFGMRAFAGNFDQDELYQAVRYCKAHGVDAHVTINTMPRCNEVKELPAWLEVLDDAGVDRRHRGRPGCLPAGPEVRPPRAEAHLHPGQHLQLRDRQRLVRLGRQPGHFGARGASGGHPRDSPKDPARSWRSRPSSTAPCA